MAYGPVLLSADLFPATIRRLVVATQATLVPPNTNRRPRFELEFLENVLDVFLHGARAAAENLSDFAVALAGRDPFGDFELACGQGTRAFGITRRSLFDFRCLAVPGGHGRIAFSGTREARPYA